MMENTSITAYSHQLEEVDKELEYDSDYQIKNISSIQEYEPST